MRSLSCRNFMVFGFCINLLLIIFGTLPARAQIAYTVTDLGLLPGSSYTQARRINNHGQIVGTADVNGTPRAFVLQPGTTITTSSLLGTLGLDRSYGNDINESGQVVGQAGAYPSTQKAFLYTPGSGMMDLGDLGLPGSQVQASAINDSGQAVGSAPNSNGYARAFVTEPNKTINQSPNANLGVFSLPAGLDPPFSFANDINNLGYIVGTNYVSGGPFPTYRAFRVTPGGKISDANTDLGTFGGGLSTANAINELGQMTGSAQNASGIWRAYRLGPTGTLSSSSAENLGSLGLGNSFGLGINMAGTVVGYYAVDRIVGTQNAAFIYTDHMVNLNNLIDSSSGWNLGSANAINDFGQILASGSHNGSSERSVLLTPVGLASAPEPSTGLLLSLTGIGFVSMQQCRRRGGRRPMRHRLLIPALTFGILGLLAATSTAQVIADSFAEFSNVQGQNNWSYGYWVNDGTYSVAEFVPFTRYFTDPAAPYWAIDARNDLPPWTEPWTELTAYGGHPNVFTGGLHWAVRRYISEVTGTISIQGILAKSPGAIVAGDGIIGRIWVGDAEVYSSAISFNDDVGISYNITTLVLAGQAIDVAIYPRSNDSFDTTYFTSVVSVINYKCCRPRTQHCGADEYRASTCLLPTWHTRKNAVAMELKSDLRP